MIEQQIAKIDKIDDLESKVEAQKKKITLIIGNSSEKQQAEHQIKTLKDLAIKQELKINELCNQITSMQAQLKKQKIIINDILEKKDENPIQVAKNFFKNQLKIDQEIKIKDAYRMGTGEQRALMIILHNPRDKSRIFGKVGNLKDAKNAKSRSYNISDDLPE